MLRLTFATTVLMLFAGTLGAQQTMQNPPAGPNQHLIQNQGASRLPADQQRFQDALRTRSLRQQGAPPNRDVNNRDPLQQVVPGQGQMDAEQHGVGNDILPSPDGGGGSSYASSNSGGVVSFEQSRYVGAADMIRSFGSYQRDVAAGEVLHENARDHAIDNQAKAIKTYFAVRELNRSLRNAERGPQPTQEDLIRYSASRVPQRLTVAEMDRQLGTINWPTALMRPEFDEHRARMEQIFQARTYYSSGVASPSFVEAKEETDRMLSTLQDLVRDIDPTAYVQSRKFVQSLGYEARFPIGDAQIAGGG